MKNFRSIQVIAAAKELLETIKKRQQLALREKILKAFIKEKMQDTDCAIAGEYLITLAECEKVNFDREKLQILLGKKINKYEKVTDYIRFDIKKIKKEIKR